MFVFLPTLEAAGANLMSLFPMLRMSTQQTRGAEVRSCNYAATLTNAKRSKRLPRLPLSARPKPEEP